MDMGEIMIDDAVRRAERRERIALWVVGVTSGVVGTVAVLRLSPSAVRKLAGPSQVGRALRSCK